MLAFTHFRTQGIPAKEVDLDCRTCAGDSCDTASTDSFTTHRNHGSSLDSDADVPHRCAVLEIRVPFRVLLTRVPFYMGDLKGTLI